MKTNLKMSNLGKKCLFTSIFVGLLSTCIATLFSKIFTSNEQLSFNVTEVGEPLFLTPYIEAGRIREAQKLAEVKVPEVDWVRKSYAGFITIHKTYRSNLYFWYFEAEIDPKKAPILLWLQGGPGSTSLLGLFAENGPFSVNEFGNPVKRNYSWHLDHHLIYVDNPVDTGYSYTKFILGHPTNSLEVGDGLYKFFLQFFELFPNLKGRDLYLSGESFAGKYIPALAYTIHKRKLEGDESTTPFNLKGIAIGSGFISPIHQIRPSEHLYQLGFIDDKTRDEVLLHEKKGAEELEKGNILRAYYAYDPIFTGITTGGSILEKSTGLPYIENYSLQKPPSYYIESTINSATWRRAMHVGNQKFHFNYGFTDNSPGRYLFLDILKSCAYMIEELLEHYRVLLFNGQLDLVCPYPGTVNMIRHLNFSSHDDYLKADRSIWRVETEIAGYVKVAGNLKEVMVRNAGHMVPADQPKWAYDLILRFTRNKHFEN